MTDRQHHHRQEQDPQIYRPSVRELTGQFVARITGTKAPAFIAGMWWDDERATQWANELARIHPEWAVSVHEIRHKDFYLPPLIKEDWSHS